MPNAVDRVSKAIEAIATSGQTSPSALVSELGMSRQAVSRLLDSLEESGLVADPFLPSEHAAGLLRVRARQIRGDSHPGEHGRVRRRLSAAPAGP